MKELPLNTVCNQLIEVLFKDMVFYIPEEIIPPKVIDKLQGSISPHFLMKFSCSILM